MTPAADTSAEAPAIAPPPLGSRRAWWAKVWIRAVLGLGSVTEAQRVLVLEEIGEGSEPTTAYYVLLGISELLAGFALIVDSDALLIGANVVAPLMLPIFGVSLGLMRGDLRLLRKAAMAEFGGAALGVALCYLLGLMPLMDEPTAALLSQTRPTLIDLIVAALAGFAGVLATIDRRVSPALPGIAIATALNPPIAAAGMCLALGAYDGAWGAFLLFIANVLAILAVGAVLFLVAGFVTRREIGSLGGLARRFAPAVLGLVLVSGLLTHYLFGLVDHLRTQSAIHAVLDSGLANVPNSALVSVEFSRSEGNLDVLATITTPRVVEPGLVKSLQEALSARLGETARLFIRCNVTQDVAATGATNVRPYLSLNGRVTQAPLSPSMRMLQQAEQVIREIAARRPDLEVQDIDLVEFPSGPALIVVIHSARPPTPELVAQFETPLRERLAEPRLRVVLRRSETMDVTSKGHILLGGAHFSEATDAVANRQAAVEQAVRNRIAARPDQFATAVDAVPAVPTDRGWQVRAEVVAPRMLSAADVRAIEQESSQAVGAPVTLSVWARSELQVTGEGYQPLGK